MESSGIQLHRLAEMRNGLRELVKRGVRIAEIVLEAK
jgi:hypothetical protein